MFRHFVIPEGNMRLHKKFSECLESKHLNVIKFTTRSNLSNHAFPFPRIYFIRELVRPHPEL